MSNSPARPIINSYWVIPGRFLAGEYPGALDEDEARTKIRRFLQAGITTFIDLTRAGEDDLRPYAGLLAEEAFRQALTVRHLRLPIQDMGTPTPDEMVYILSTIAACLAKDENLYLHCWGGRGRTGTVIGCYLVQQGTSGDQALDQIRKWRRVTDEAHLNSPETFGQRVMVLNWWPRRLDG